MALASNGRHIDSIGPAHCRRLRRADSNRSWFIAAAPPNCRRAIIAAAITTADVTLPSFPIGIGTITLRTLKCTECGSVGWVDSRFD